MCFRYEMNWLPLAARESDMKKISPPLDVYWVWHTHMLCPLQYAVDLQKVVGKVIDHAFPTTRRDDRTRKATTKSTWEKLYKGNPFEIDLNADYTNSAPPRYQSKISYNLEQAIVRQRDFFYNVSLPHYMDEGFLQNALERYGKFLQMKLENR